LLCAGKKEKITIKAEKGRLSDDEIQRMVQEAEEFAEQDKAIKAKVDARNQLETYCYRCEEGAGFQLGGGGEGGLRLVL
jgi:heat shock protein 5